MAKTTEIKEAVEETVKEVVTPKMNVYQKLQLARVMLQEKGLKKTGKNTYSNYDYFELGDFLPEINKIFNDLLLFSMCSFTTEIATLTVVDTETGDNVVFTSPMAEANLKGCHPIQNMGAAETYSRRYLYVMALEIVENCTLDENTGNATVVPTTTTTTTTTAQTKGSLSDKQINRLYAIANSKGYNQEKVKAMIAKKYSIDSTKDLSKSQYDDVVKGFESLPNKE